MLLRLFIEAGGGEASPEQSVCLRFCENVLTRMFPHPEIHFVPATFVFVQNGKFSSIFSKFQEGIAAPAAKCIITKGGKTYHPGFQSPSPL